VGPTCKQCEAKIDPPAEPAAVYDGCPGALRRLRKLQYGYAFRTISGRDIVRRCIACENGPKAVKFWEEKPPPPESAEVRRQGSLSNVKKERLVPQEEKERSRPRKLTARNAKYIEQKQQKSK
ncbi:hypothetical protein GN244_ATG15162, partial [Phytophthora infestans]